MLILHMFENGDRPLRVTLFNGFAIWNFIAAMEYTIIWQLNFNHVVAG